MGRGDSASATPGSRSKWIIGPGADTTLILAVPLLCIAGVQAAVQQWSAYTVWAVVMTFGAVGHHLPGFMRTYGDRDMFARHRIRFLVAPVVLFASSYVFARHNLHGVLLVSLVWSIWHGMMQHYGFMRIYAAKVGSTDPRTARLDWWMTVSWFGLCLTMSPHQKGSVLDSLYASGFDIVPARVLGVLDQLAVVLVIVVTVAYAVHHIQRRRDGLPVSALKLVLLVSTTGLVYLARVVTTDPFVSVALFEVMHDVQYLAIVWAFNRRRFDRSAGLGRLMFQPRFVSIALYVGLCLAFGAVGYATNELMSESAAKEILVAVLITSGLLHFYYDGFIWKLRRTETRDALNLAGGRAVPEDGARRDLAHLAAFCLPVLALWHLESRGTQTTLAQAQSIVEATPDDVTAQQNAGAALFAAGRFSEALPHLEAAARLQPDLHQAQHRLGGALLQLDRHDEAIVVLERAVALAPRDGESRHALGTARLKAGDLAGALADLEQARDAGIDSAALNNDLGFALLNSRRFDDAAHHLQRAVLIDPNHAGAFLNLGLLYGSTRQLPQAEAALRRAVELRPDFADAHNNLGGVLMMQGHQADAIRSFERAIEIDPDFEPALHNLRRARGSG